jgi:hypothetical protein
METGCPDLRERIAKLIAEFCELIMPGVAISLGIIDSFGIPVVMVLTRPGSITQILVSSSK